MINCRPNYLNSVDIGSNFREIVPKFELVQRKNANIFCMKIVTVQKAIGTRIQLQLQRLRNFRRILFLQQPNIYVVFDFVRQQYYKKV